MPKTRSHGLSCLNPQNTKAASMATSKTNPNMASATMHADTTGSLLAAPADRRPAA